MFQTIGQAFEILDRDARWRLAGVALLVLLASALEVLGIGLVFPFIKLVSEPSLADSMAPLAWLRDAVGAADHVSFLIVCGIGLMVLFVFKSTLGAVVAYLQLGILQRIAAEVSVRLVGRFLHGPYILHVQRNSAEMIATVRDVVFQTYNAFVLGFVQLVTELVVGASIAILLFVVEPLGSVLAVAILAVGAGLLHRVMDRRFVAWGRENVALFGDTIRALQQGFGGAKEIKVLGREDFFVAAYRHRADSLARNNHLRQAAMQLPRFLYESMLVIGILTVAVVVLRSDRDTGTVTAVLALFAAAGFRLMPSANRMTTAWNLMSNGRAGVETLHRDMAVLPRRPVEHGNDAAPLGLGEVIVGENVSYRYPGAGESALTDGSFVIRRGEVIGLVGASGAGKTTFADVIMGLLPPTTGQLLVDGIAIEGEAASRWQRTIGYVPQAPFLLDDTIRRNVAFGIEDPTSRTTRCGRRCGWHNLRLSSPPCQRGWTPRWARTRCAFRAASGNAWPSPAPFTMTPKCW